MDHMVMEDPRGLATRVYNIWKQARTAIADWPQQPLLPVHKPAPFIKPLSAFPNSFQADLERIAF
jgi:hypothetical protein